MCGVLDDDEAAIVGDAAQRPHVGELAVEVHRQDPARAGADRSAHAVRIDQARRRLDVDEDRRGAGEQHGVRGGRKRHRRGDDLVAGANVERAQGDEQSHGARVRAHDSGRLGAAAAADQKSAHLVLERGDLRAKGEEERIEHAAERGGLLLAEPWGVLTDRLPHSRLGQTPEGHELAT